MSFKRPYQERKTNPYTHQTREYRSPLEKLQGIMDKLGERYCIECGTKLNSGNSWIMCTPDTGEGVNLERLRNSLIAKDKVKEPPTKEQWVKIYKTALIKPFSVLGITREQFQPKCCFKCGIGISPQNHAIALCCQSCEKDNGALWGKWDED